MRNISILLGALAFASLASSCDHDHGEGSRGHAHAPGPNGGDIYDLPEVGHIETLHDHETGEIRIFLTGPDAESPLKIDKAPQVKLMTDSGPQVIDMDPVGGSLPAAEFDVKHAALAVEEPKGRLSIDAGGKSFNPDLTDLRHE
jgi:hypothetical protein